MEENEQKKIRKPGLHKEISSIFDGVPIPGASESAPEADRVSKQGPVEGPAVPPAVKAEQPLQKPSRTASLKETKGASPIKGSAVSVWQKIIYKLCGSKENLGSTRQKVMAILIPILFVILIFALFRVFRSPGVRVTKPPKPEPTGADRGPAGAVEWNIPEPYPTTIRDPMRVGATTIIETEPEVAGPTKVDVEEAVQLSIRGIVHSRDNPVAVVGTQIVHQGDKVSGATVVKINQDSVEFEKNGKKWTQKIQ